MLALATYILPVAYNFSVSQADRGIALGVVSAVALGAMMCLGPFEFLVLAGLTVLFVRPSLAALVLFAPLVAAFMGVGRGALLGAVAGAWAELLMLLSGHGTLGILTGGADSPLYTPQSSPAKSLLDYSWVNPPTPPPTPTSTGTPLATPTVSPYSTPIIATPTPVDVSTPGHLIMSDFLAKLFSPFINSPVLLGQIGLWALTGGVVATLMFLPRLRTMPAKLPPFMPRAFEPVRAWFARPRWNAIPATVLSMLGGVVILAVGHSVLSALLAQQSIGIGPILGGTLLPALLVVLAAPLLAISPQALVPSAIPPLREAAAPLAVTTAGRSTKFPEKTSVRKEVPADTWTELAGVDGIQQEVMEALESQFNPRMRDLLKRLSLRPTRGILLFGPPGTGKTKLARVIAHEAGASFFAVSGTEFTSKWVGESEANLRRIFEEARESRPSSSSTS